LVGIQGKNLTWLFLIFFVSPCVLLFMLAGSRSLSDYITTTFYVITLAFSLIILKEINTDEQYYEPLTLEPLIASVLLGVGMFALSAALSLSLKNSDMLLSIVPLTLTASPTSIATTFLSASLFGLALIASGEELWKLPMFAEGRARWGKGYNIPRVVFAICMCLLGLLVAMLLLNALNVLSYFNFGIVAVVLIVVFALVFSLIVKRPKFTVPGILIYVGVPVGFWAALHGIEAYSNPVMILPAAVNGVVLIVYLWKYRCILGCIFAHFIYNTLITALSYFNGTANVQAGLPLFPDFFSRSYYSNSGFIYDYAVIAIWFFGVFLFLLPSLTKQKANKK